MPEAHTGEDEITGATLGRPQITLLKKEGSNPSKLGELKCGETGDDVTELEETWPRFSDCLGVDDGTEQEELVGEEEPFARYSDWLTVVDDSTVASNLGEFR